MNNKKIFNKNILKIFIIILMKYNKKYKIDNIYVVINVH